MLLAVLAGFAVGLLVPHLIRAGSSRAGWLISLFPLGLMVWFAQFLPQIRKGERVLSEYRWLPDLGVNLSFCLDGLSLLFALLITGVGTVVCVYSGGYFSSHGDLRRFYPCLLVFMASMLGLVLADNVIALFVFWELTSVSSYLLIGFDHHREPARRAALQALLVTSFGGLALLAAFLLMHQVTGTFEISRMLERADVLKTSLLYPTVLVLVLVGAATKSAQVPFHFWLPSAMEAPTPVSTYLHAATMVKAGIYLLARFTPILGGTKLWTGLLVPLGAATMVTAAWMALFHTDLKRILAYTTVSALGICVVLLGIGTASSFHACMTFVMAHSLYKGGLFLTAGIIDHETGTRNVEELGRLSRAMPLTCIATLLAALSSAGAPPFLGFLGKEQLYEATLQAPHREVLTALAVLTSTLFTAMAGVVGIRPFFGGRANLSRPPHDPSLGLWIGPIILGILGLLLGWMPSRPNAMLIVPATSSGLGVTIDAEAILWHGIDLKLQMSFLGLAAGGVVFWKWDAVRRAFSRVRPLGKYGPEALYDLSLKTLLACARAQTRFFQHGYLHLYLLTVVGTSIGLLAWALLSDSLPQADFRLHRLADMRPYEAIIAVILLVGALVVATAASRLVAIVALGVVGYGTALMFLFFSAPDLAMTQFAIETLSVILLVLVLFKLPKFQSFSGKGSRARDGALAVSAGAVMTLLVLAVTALDRPPRLASLFAEQSLLLAKGRNVVNVILVDFRGFDTLGEITVLSVAAIGVYSLLRLRFAARDGRLEEGQRAGPGQ